MHPAHSKRHTRPGNTFDCEKMKRSRIELLELAKAANITSCHKLKKSKIVELLFTDAAVHIQYIARKRAMYRPINTVDLSLIHI